MISFEGVADEQFDPNPHFVGLRGEVYVVATLVKRISSIAIKRWIACFEAQRDAGLSVRFVGISTAIVEQFNAISNFGAGFPVLSAVLPFTCIVCEKPSPVLKTRDEALALDLDRNDLTCAHCGAGNLAFDDLPGEYLKFWRSTENRSRET